MFKTNLTINSNLKLKSTNLKNQIIMKNLLSNSTKFIVCILGQLLSFNTYCQHYWQNNPTLPQTYTNGTVSIGVSPGPDNAKLRVVASENTPYGAIIYNTSNIASPNTKHGLYVYLNDSSNNINNFGIYSTVPVGSNYWAGYFEGNGYFSGNLGIGVGYNYNNPPIDKLSVWEGNITLGGNYNRFVIHHQWWNNSSNTLFLAPWNYNSNAWDFQKGIQLRTDGLVTMQNVSVTDTLKVHQKIWARAVEVKLPPFPDYVFKTDYHLMPLDSVADFIKINGHLPGLPSASTIDTADGYDLGNLLVKQMEKIEELTLYILYLKTELEKIKQTNCQNSSQH